MLGVGLTLRGLSFLGVRLSDYLLGFLLSDLGSDFVIRLGGERVQGRVKTGQDSSRREGGSEILQDRDTGPGSDVPDVGL